MCPDSQADRFTLIQLWVGVFLNTHEEENTGESYFVWCDPVLVVNGTAQKICEEW